MLHELETKIINAYLSKEITLLEKQAALLVAAKFVDKDPNYNNVNETFDTIISIGKLWHSYYANLGEEALELVALHLEKSAELFTKNKI